MPDNLNTNTWKTPIPQNDPVIREPAQTEQTQRTMPQGDPYLVQMTLASGENEFIETHLFFIAPGLNPHNPQFQNMVMRYWWDEDDGSPMEDDGYRWSDDVWVGDGLDFCTAITRESAQELFNTNMYYQSHVYSQENLTRWVAREPEYNEYHDY